MQARKEVVCSGQQQQQHEYRCAAGTGYTASYNLYKYISELSFCMIVVWGTLSNMGHAATLEIVYLPSYSRFKIANGDNWPTREVILARLLVAHPVRPLVSGAPRSGDMFL
jgi:hypothetical protein